MCDCQKKCNCSQTKLSPVDLTKPVQTVGGSAARIIATDRKGDFPVVALIEYTYGSESTLLYDDKGQFMGLPTVKHNLVNIPVREERFLNLYLRTDFFKLSFTAHASLNAAKAAGENRVGVLKVTFEDNKPVSAEILDV